MCDSVMTLLDLSSISNDQIPRIEYNENEIGTWLV